VEATFDPQTQLFRLHATGCLVNGSKFERLAGKEGMKKWRSSVRVIEGEHAGRTIGHWMEVFGLDPPKKRGERPGGLRMYLGGRKPGGRGAGGRAGRELPRVYGRLDRPVVYTEERDREIASLDLSSLRMGWRSGDPTVNDQDLPKTLSHSTDCIWLNGLGALSLRREASLGLAPAAVTLPREYAPAMPPSTKWSDVPGCPAGGHAAGHRGSDDSLAAMAVYIGDENQELPLASMGLKEAPAVDGTPIDLRKVYWEVQDRGGFEQVSSLDTWQPVAEAATGLKNLKKREARSVMNMYRVFLLDLDDSGRELGVNRKKARGTGRGRNGREVADRAPSPDRTNAGARPLTNWEEVFAQCSPAPYLHLIDTEEKFWQCVKEFEDLPEIKASAVERIPKVFHFGKVFSESVPVYKMFLDTTRLGGYEAMKARRGLRVKVARERFNLHFQNCGTWVFGDTQGWRDKLQKSMTAPVSIWARLQLSMLESFLMQKSSGGVQDRLPVADVVRPSSLACEAGPSSVDRPSEPQEPQEAVTEAADNDEGRGEEKVHPFSSSDEAPEVHRPSSQTADDVLNHAEDRLAAAQAAFAAEREALMRSRACTDEEANQLFGPICASIRAGEPQRDDPPRAGEEEGGSPDPKKRGEADLASEPGNGGG